PDIVRQAREDRLFLGRVVRYLAGEAGIRQFLDIGTGLPTADNTHQVAQLVALECKIVYVGNDPLVLAHARALLTSTPEGTTDYIHADMHDPANIVAGAARTLDFGQPIAITMLGVLWHVMDNDEAHAIVSRLVQAMPSGSYLALNHPALEVTGEKMATAIRYWNEYGTPPGTHRTPGELARVLRRHGPGRARRGLDHTPAARGHDFGRARRDRPVRRRRSQAMIRHQPLNTP
ncbi:MAG: SAM-dependent methyltransferase, partial [Pseudonocardiaceae bacterium]